MNQFKFLGTITNILPIQKGTSQSGKEWQKLQFVVKEEKADYPQSMVFTMMDIKKIENFTKYEKVGNAVEVSFNLSAREYNGKWYADVTAWSVFGGGKTNDVTPVSVSGSNLDLSF